MVLKGKCSSWKEVLSGVPQGSVLGPILFLIFINGLSGVARMIDAVRKFADDTKLGQRAGTVGKSILAQPLFCWTAPSQI